MCGSYTVKPAIVAGGTKTVTEGTKQIAFFVTSSWLRGKSFCN